MLIGPPAPRSSITAREVDVNVDMIASADDAESVTEEAPRSPPPPKVFASLPQPAIAPPPVAEGAGREPLLGNSRQRKPSSSCCGGCGCGCWLFFTCAALTLVCFGTPATFLLLDLELPSPRPLAPSPPPLAPSAPCVGVRVGAQCWMLGPPGQACLEACATHDAFVDAQATLSQGGSARVQAELATHYRLEPRSSAEIPSRTAEIPSRTSVRAARKGNPDRPANPQGPPPQLCRLAGQPRCQGPPPQLCRPARQPTGV